MREVQAENSSLRQEVMELRQQLEDQGAEVEQLTTENEARQGQLRELTERGAQLPDLLEIRDRILSNLKLGTQSTQYKIARKALDRFIKALGSMEQ